MSHSLVVYEARGMRVALGCWHCNRQRQRRMKVGTPAVQAIIENNELVIRMPLDKPTPASSGKTLMIASMGGNVQRGR